jgi:23S rRNA (uridine2552-2'-O)-methyltransferase
LLRSGQRVMDLGCWPGGWLQVASRLVGPRGRVVGLDRTPLDAPLESRNTLALCGDLEDPETPARLLEALGDRADVLLCDAAPKLSGVRSSDRVREEQLLLVVEARLSELLCPGGSLVLKLLEGPEAQAVAQRLRGRFERAKIVRVRATRRGSSERYLVGHAFQPDAGA